MEAFKIDSSMARALVQAANEKVFLGDPSGAIPLATHALQLSPSDRSIGVFYWVLGRAYFTMGNEYPNAIEWLQRSVNVRPNLWFVWVWLSAAHALNGNKDGAKDVRDEFMKRFEGWNLERIIGVYSKEQYQNPTLEAAKTELINGLRIAEFP